MTRLMSMRHVACLFLFTALVGCAGTTGVPTGTPEDSAAICIQAVTTSRKAATALLRAGKITIARDMEIQASLDSLVPGCRELANPGARP